MLGGERQIRAQTGQIYPASTSSTVGEAFSKPFAQVKQIGDYVFAGASTDETIRKSSERIALMQAQIDTPGQGLGQRSLNTIGGFVGSMLATAPFMVAGGAVGGGVASAVGFGARKLALSAIAGEASEGVATAYLAAQTPLKNLATGSMKMFLPAASTAELAGDALSFYTATKGMEIPEKFSKHYDSVNNAFDVSHAIEDWGSDNYGFMLGGSAMAAGYVAYRGVRGVLAMRAAGKSAKELDDELGRLLRGHEETTKENQRVHGEQAAKQGKVSELQAHLQTAEEEGLISPQLHEWYLDYLEHPNHPDTHKRGLDALKELQIPYDRFTGRVWNEVLTKEGVQNLKGALFDESITAMGEEDRQLLSTYIVHNQLDAYAAMMRENPNMLMAMNGMTSDITRKIAAHDLALREFKFALDKTIPKSTLKRQVFTQNNLYKHLKSLGVTTSREVPYYVPRRVIEKLQLADEIGKIEGRATPQLEKKFQNNRHLELKKKLNEMKLMSHSEEMKHLTDKLFPGGELAENFSMGRAYNRLQDLKQVWPNAKTASDIVDMAAMNKKQSGLNEALKRFISLADKKIEDLANPEMVKTYLNRRIDASVPKARELEKFGLDKKANITEDQVNSVKGVEGESVEGKSEQGESVINDELKSVVENSKLEFAKENFESSEMKIKQWQASGKALDDLIACVWGA